MRIEVDPHPFSRGGSWAILTISIMHIYQAYMLHFYPTSVHATNMTSIVTVLDWFISGIVEHSDRVTFVQSMIDTNTLYVYRHLIYIEWFMYMSSVIAIVGALFRLGFTRLLVFLPQHLLIGAMAFGGVYASMKGYYLDGTHVPWPHISVDQIGYLALFSIHSSAIVRRCRDPNG